MPSSLESLAALEKRLRPVIAPEQWDIFAQDILAIRQLKKERQAAILAHNYMTPEIVYGVADVVGDSLAMARQACELTADTIVVAGVHFMAETAKLLNPSRTVLIPDPSAGCSLAQAVTPEDVRDLRKKHPGVPIVTYVNTSAAVKAECDICCTSANAVKVVDSLNAPEVFMLPDEYLARNTAKKTKVKILSWKGHCEVHERFTPENVRALRAEYPGLVVIAHPECPPNVIACADFSGSTADMGRWIEEKKPEKALLLTEGSMSDVLAVQYPDTRFANPGFFCPHMKKVTLRAIRHALENGEYAITIPEDIAVPARRSVERMMAIS